MTEELREQSKEQSIMPIGTIVSWYWRVVRKYRWWFTGGFVFYGIGIICIDILPPIVYKHIVDVISGESSVDREGIWMWLAVLAGVFFVGYVSFRMGDIFTIFSQSRAMQDIACFSFEKLQHHSYRFFANSFSGSIVSKTRRYVDAFSDLHDGLTYSIWIQSVSLIGMFVGMFVFSPLISFSFLFGILIISLVSIPLLKRRWRFNDFEAEEDSKVTGRLSDVMTNILAVKMFSARSHEEATFREYANRQERMRSDAWKAFILMAAVQNGLAMLLQFFGLFLSIWLWFHGKISAGTVILVQTYLLNIFGMIWQLTRSVSNMLRAAANATEMIRVLEEVPDILDPQHPELDRIRDGRVDFQNVSFKYTEGENVFEHFSLSLKKGEKVGLVGPSGGGKSTITKLLLRFVDPQSGEICIDGQNIRNIRQDDLRSHIAYVPQEPLLFHRSIRENIAYGKFDATDVEVIDAAKKAEAHEFIARLPKGYDTLVGERGVKLSGGERQRIAIARAILKNAPVLVLDEATSALDSESEHAIQLALDDLMEGKTAMVIAHRLSTIRRLDRIVVLNRDGKIEEEGTHEDLLKHGGLYAKLWGKQTGGFLEE